MVNSYLNNKSLKDALEYGAVKKNWLELLVKVLKPFEEAITALEVSIFIYSLSSFHDFQAENKPTLHLVARIYKKFMLAAQKYANDNDMFIKALGTAFKEALKKKETQMLSKYHLAAVMLYPPVKKMQKFSESEREIAKTTLESLENSWMVPVPASTQLAVPEDDDDFLDDDAITTPATFLDEVQSYQNSSEAYTDDDDLLKWWYARRQTYPRLSAVAKKLLAFPASSASAERAFSRLRLLLTDYRTRMNADTVKGLMLGGCY